MFEYVLAVKDLKMYKGKIFKCVKEIAEISDISKVLYLIFAYKQLSSGNSV